MSYYKSIIRGLLCVVLCIGSLQGRSWDEIKESGILKVGMRDLSSLAYDSTNKTYPGFLYEMAYAFAKSNDLKIELVIMDSFSAYWTYDGEVLTQTNRIEVPQIYDTIDLAAEAFTITPQRQRLIHMSPYIDNMEFFWQ